MSVVGAINAPLPKGTPATQSQEPPVLVRVFPCPLITTFVTGAVTKDVTPVFVGDRDYEVRMAFGSNNTGALYCVYFFYQSQWVVAATFLVPPTSGNQSNLCVFWLPKNVPLYLDYYDSAGPTQYCTASFHPL